MGGCSLEYDLEYTSPLTLVLVGKTGNGISATGKSIVGMDVFDSKPSATIVVTNTYAWRATILKDGRLLNVIDTPGVDSSAASESINKGIASWINMDTHGIHAVLVVFSVCSPFSVADEGVISGLLTLFGRRIYDYIIIVFTGGDVLESQGKTLDDFLYDCPEALKEILCLCGNRSVVFNNMTKNQTKKANQVEQLMFLVNMVLKKNGGQPYTKGMYNELKDQAEKFQSLKKTKQYTEEELSLLLENMFEGHFKQNTEMFESRLQQLLGKERDARLMSEEAARTEQTKSNEEIEKLRDSLDLIKFNLIIIFIILIAISLFSFVFGFKVNRNFF